MVILEKIVVIIVIVVSLCVAPLMVFSLVLVIRKVVRLFIKIVWPLPIWQLCIILKTQTQARKRC